MLSEILESVKVEKTESKIIELINKTYEEDALNKLNDLIDITKKLLEIKDGKEATTMINSYKKDLNVKSYDDLLWLYQSKLKDSTIDELNKKYLKEANKKASKVIDKVKEKVKDVKNIELEYDHNNLWIFKIIDKKDNIYYLNIEVIIAGGFIQRPHKRVLVKVKKSL